MKTSDELIAKRLLKSIQNNPEKALKIIMKTIQKEKRKAIQGYRESEEYDKDQDHALDFEDSIEFQNGIVSY